MTGIALLSGFQRVGIDLSLFTLVVAHATFCVVIVYNNAAARLRRMSPNLEEASADLGAHTLQTFRFVIFPLMRSALVAGGLLAFALSLRRDRRHDVHGRRRLQDAAALVRRQLRRARTPSRP